MTEAGGVANGTPGIPTATGNLSSTDVDNPDDGWILVVNPISSDNGYGSYTLTAAGVWAYTLDNSNAAVQALNVGGTLTDTFTATTIDGTAQLVTITINGTNDIAVITGPVAAAVIEAGGVANGTSGTPTATGDLNSTDVDNPNDTWTAVGSPTASANGYGSYTLTTAGVWVYTLDNSSAAVQALNVGDTLTDSFTVTTIGGAAQLVTVTIHGADDAAVITGATTGDVVEAGGVGSGIPGVPTTTGDLDTTDVDSPPDDWTPVATPTPGDNGFGAYTLTAAGVWTYTLDNSNVAVQALGTGATLTDTFTAIAVDGTAQLVTVTIHGTDDAAVISGDITGAVLEAGGVANGTPGTPTATGDLDAADVDNPPDWTPVGTPAPGDNGFGTYTLTAAGVWTYTLDNTNAAVQALNAGQTLTDTFTATITGRHHPAGDHHHQWRQRHGRDQRHRQRGGDRGRWCRQRRAGDPDRDRRSELDRRRQHRRPLGSSRHVVAGRQRLQHLHPDSGRRLDLHAGQYQRRRAGAQCRADPDRHLHRHHGRRHRATRHHHHHRHQRCRGDQRHRQRIRHRGRRRRQRDARHACRDRRSELGRCRQYGRCLDGGRHGNRKHQRLRQLHADGCRGLDLHPRRQSMPRFRRSMSVRR